MYFCTTYVNQKKRSFLIQLLGPGSGFPSHQRWFANEPVFFNFQIVAPCGRSPSNAYLQTIIDFLLRILSAYFFSSLDESNKLSTLWVTKGSQHEQLRPCSLIQTYTLVFCRTICLSTLELWKPEDKKSAVSEFQGLINGTKGNYKEISESCDCRRQTWMKTK